MSEYELVNDQFKDKWINKPNNLGDVGDLQDITEELNNLLRERDEARELQIKSLREREATEKKVDAMLERAHKAERERNEAREQLRKASVEANNLATSIQNLLMNRRVHDER